MKPVMSRDGRRILHVWRAGVSYWHQKSPIFLTQCTPVKLVRLPYGRTPPIFHVRLGSKRLPFPDGCFDVTYIYHILEHVSYHERANVMGEIARTLRPGGVLRISVQDFEGHIRRYLDALGSGDQPLDADGVQYLRWCRLRITDQMVRTHGGGEMLDAWRDGEWKPETLKELFGDGLRQFTHPSTFTHSRGYRMTLSDLPFAVYRKLRLRLSGGDPRLVGEADLWHDDELSMRDLLLGHGFTDIRRHTYKTSDIDGWENYDFDRSNFGDYPLEPSLYLETRKL